MLKQGWKALHCPSGQVVLPDFQGTAQRGPMLVTEVGTPNFPPKPI